MKRDKLDAVFSDLVRGRANWRCEVCGAGRDAHLECSHIFGRAKISVRWHPDNATCLCHHHHRQFTQHPLYHAEWVREKFGVKFYDRLIRLANTPRHFKRAEKEAIYRAYKVTLAQMNVMLSDWDGSRIDFQFPDLSNVQPIPRKPKARKAKPARSGRKMGHPTLKRKVSGEVVRREKAA
jgi:hypothetical protein